MWYGPWHNIFKKYSFKPLYQPLNGGNIIGIQFCQTFYTLQYFKILNKTKLYRYCINGHASFLLKRSEVDKFPKVKILMAYPWSLQQTHWPNWKRQVSVKKFFKMLKRIRKVRKSKNGKLINVGQKQTENRPKLIFLNETSHSLFFYYKEWLNGIKRLR